MGTVRSHLQKFHKDAEGIHVKHEEKSRESGDEIAAAYHHDMAACHKAMHAECSGSDDNTTKAADGNDGKVAVESISVAQMEEFRQGLHKLGQFAELFGNQIRPDSIHGIAGPAPRAIPRTGAPELVNRKDIPVEFSEMLKVE